MKTINLEELVQTSEDFITFHRSVNLIREICQGEIHEVGKEHSQQVIGKFEMEDL
jgi:hypothetical protein